ncbi:hypothetical protein SUDANB95_02877 [Actinosynnema sp. ALI-1.44]
MAEHRRLHALGGPPPDTTAAVNNLPRLCMAPASCCTRAVKFAAEAPGSGYSQSMSTPSKPYWLTTFTTLLTNVVRLDALAANASNAESSPLFHPPTANDTRTPAACPRLTSADGLAGSGIAWSVPLALGRAKA